MWIYSSYINMHISRKALKHSNTFKQQKLSTSYIHLHIHASCRYTGEVNRKYQSLQHVEHKCKTVGSQIPFILKWMFNWFCFSSEKQSVTALVLTFWYLDKFIWQMNMAGQRPNTIANHTYELNSHVHTCNYRM